MMKSELMEIYEGLREMEALLCCAQSYANEADPLSIALLHILSEMRGLNLRLKTVTEYQEKEMADND